MPTTEPPAYTPPNPSSRVRPWGSKRRAASESGSGVSLPAPTPTPPTTTTTTKRSLFSRSASTATPPPPAIIPTPAPAAPLAPGINPILATTAQTHASPPSTPNLSKRLTHLIKTENRVIESYTAAGQSRLAVAKELSAWGEQSADPAVSDLSDKLGVLLSELGSLELAYASRLDAARTLLKPIRNTEAGVAPTREAVLKTADEIRRTRYKSANPNVQRLAALEQERVRAEAANLVAETQLVNVTRAHLRAALGAHFVAVVERAEKSAALARHSIRLLSLLEPVGVAAPGEKVVDWTAARTAREILKECEEELLEWTPPEDLLNLLETQPVTAATATTVAHPAQAEKGAGVSAGTVRRLQGGGEAVQGTHPALRVGTGRAARERSRVQQQQQQMMVQHAGDEEDDEEEDEEDEVPGGFPTESRRERERRAVAYA